MNNLEKAKKILSDGGYTCVLYNGKETVCSTERGVAPLLKLYDENVDYSSFSAADKVVGNGAAFLYVLLQIKELHAFVISTPALKTLTDNNIKVTFDTKTSAIRNRTNTGFCPIESAVTNITSPKKALTAIKAKVQGDRKALQST